jgi:cysteine synthase
MIQDHILSTVGNTPMIRINMEKFKNIRLYAKAEFLNPTGSVKDRAAFFVIKKLLNLPRVISVLPCLLIVGIMG